MGSNPIELTIVGFLGTHDFMNAAASSRLWFESHQAHHCGVYADAMNDPSASPCTKVCTLDAATGFCLGCGRSGHEIASWLDMSVAERIALKAQLPARMATLKRANTRCVLPGKR